MTKDSLPGPYPKTPEERAAAAKKYNLRAEDYEPYPDNGEGLVLFSGVNDNCFFLLLLVLVLKWLFSNFRLFIKCTQELLAPAVDVIA